MQIKPMIRSNICLNAHPAGCAAGVLKQIEYAKKHLSPTEGTPKLVLVVGCSNGYGLASRICAGFGYKAVTVGVSLENEPSEKRTGTSGFYNNQAFDMEAAFLTASAVLDFISSEKASPFNEIETSPAFAVSLSNV